MPKSTVSSVTISHTEGSNTVITIGQSGDDNYVDVSRGDDYSVRITEDSWPEIRNQIQRLFDSRKPLGTMTQ